MKSLHIVSDTDGVITDRDAFIYGHAVPYFVRKFVNKHGYFPENRFDVVKDQTAYEPENIFGCSKEEIRGAMRDLLIHYCKYCLPREYVSEAHVEWQEKNHNLYNATARKYVKIDNVSLKNLIYQYKSRKMLLKYYKNYIIPFDDITFCSEKDAVKDKTEAFIKYEGDIMIEDQPKIANSIASLPGSQVLLMDTFSNQNCSAENITRIFNHYQAADFIQAYAEEDQDKVNKVKQLILKEKSNYTYRIFP